MQNSGASKPLIIVGAGGHGRVVLDAAREAQMMVAGFIDTIAMTGTDVNGSPVLGGNALLQDLGCLNAHIFIVAIGDQHARGDLSRLLLERASLATVIHPRTTLSESASIGVGTVITAGVIVNANAKVGRYCILNTGCTIDHDNDLADGVQVCPGAHLAGNVRCGTAGFIGTGAIVIPGISIGANAIVGAGSVVVRDVPGGDKVAGNPAKAMNSK